MSMKKTVLTALLGLAAAAATSIAFAGEGGHGHPGQHDRLKKADTNGDGLISKAEAASLPRLAEHFDAIDANKDGQVSAEEMRAMRAKGRGEHWKKLDTNGDGMLSKAEVAGRPRLAERFDAIDANKDGQVTQDEMKAAHPRGGRKS